jgi:hypothetical protein
MLPGDRLPTTPRPCSFSHCETRDVYTWPHIGGAVFNAASLVYSGSLIIASPEFPIVNAFASPTQNGLAVVAWWGGNNNPLISNASPGIIMFVNDEFSPFGLRNNFPNLNRGDRSPWDVHILDPGTNSFLPHTTERWGDFLRVRPYGGDGSLWIASGYIFQQGNDDISKYFVAGREAHRGEAGSPRPPTFPITRIVLAQDWRGNNVLSASVASPATTLDRSIALSFTGRSTTQIISHFVCEKDTDVSYTEANCNIATIAPQPQIRIPDNTVTGTTHYIAHFGLNTFRVKAVDTVGTQAQSPAVNIWWVGPTSGINENEFDNRVFSPPPGVPEPNPPPNPAFNNNTTILDEAFKSLSTDIGQGLKAYNSGSTKAAIGYFRNASNGINSMLNYLRTNQVNNQTLASKPIRQGQEQQQLPTAQNNTAPNQAAPPQPPMAQAPPPIQQPQLSSPSVAENNTATTTGQNATTPQQAPLTAAPIMQLPPPPTIAQNNTAPQTGTPQQTTPQMCPDGSQPDPNGNCPLPPG